MKHHKKFASQEQQQVSEVQSQQKVEREFASVEELLRFDAKQTGLPRKLPNGWPGHCQRSPAFLVRGGGDGC